MRCESAKETLPPANLGEPYPSYASTVDADGNELAGIRLPDLTVPVATNTGWVSRHPDMGGFGQVLDMMGSSLPFAALDAERAEQNDPRPSIAERYRDRDDYADRVREAAQKLAAQRYIVEDDVDVVVELALERYDLFARQPAGVAMN